MADKKDQPAKNLRVLHTQLDTWPKGFVLSPDDLPDHAPRGSTPEEHQKAREKQVQRLISIGAVEETDDPRTGDAPLGPQNLGKAPSAPAPATTQADGLDDMTVSDLRDEAARRKVEIPTGAHKQDIIDALRAKK